MSRLRRAATIPFVSVLFLATGAEARRGAEPPGWATGADLAPVEVVELAAIDRPALLAADATREAPGVPLRIAAVVEVAITLAGNGTWTTLSDGRRLWRLRIRAPGATDLSLGFARYRLPPGASLHVWGEVRPDLFAGPYDDRDNEAHGELWTPVVPGERAVVELVVPPGVAFAPELSLGHVGRGYRDFLGLEGAAGPDSGACNIDVICPEGDPWRDQIRSVGRMVRGGGASVCTGTMIRNVAGDCRPLFLTAEHCGITPATAASVVVYWNYEVATCDGPRFGPLDQNQSGSTHLASNSESDFVLVELDDLPDPSWNVYYSGWDRSGDAADSGVAIHHPSGDEKAISINQNRLTTVDCWGTPVHWLIDDWEAGTTEGGSSGGGYWDEASHLLVGTLSGGNASCQNPGGEDCYGKFSEHWNIGGSSTGRLRDWLDPSATAPTSLPGLECVAAMSYAGNSSVDSCAARPANENDIWEPGETIELAVELAAGNTPLTGVTGSLVILSAGVTPFDSFADWPDLSPGVPTATVAPHFRFRIGDTFPCFIDVLFRLTVSSNELPDQVFDFRHPVGSGGQCQPCTALAARYASHTGVDSCSLDPANDNGVWEPGEIIELTVALAAEGGDLTGVSGGLAIATPGVTMLDPTATWPDLTDGLPTASDAPHFRLELADTVPCLSMVDVDLTILSNELPPTVVTFSQQVGSGASCAPCEAPCIGQVIAANTLKATKGGGDTVVLHHPVPASPCATGVQVWTAETARPTIGEGLFPTDPSFAEVTSEDLEPAADRFRHPRPRGDVYYLVVEELPGGLPGPSGRYSY